MAPPIFDPSQPFTVVSEPKVERPSPKFDPSQPFTVVSEPSPTPAAAPSVSRPTLTDLLATPPDTSLGRFIPSEPHQATSDPRLAVFEMEAKARAEEAAKPLVDPLIAAYTKVTKPNHTAEQIQADAIAALDADRDNFDPAKYLSDHPDIASDDFHFKTVLDVYKARQKEGLILKRVISKIPEALVGYDVPGVGLAGQIVEGAVGQVKNISKGFGPGPELFSDEGAKARKKVAASTMVAVGGLGDLGRKLVRKTGDLVGLAPDTDEEWEDRLYSDVKMLQRFKTAETGENLPFTSIPLAGKDIEEVRAMSTVDPLTLAAGVGAFKLASKLPGAAAIGRLVEAPVSTTTQGALRATAGALRATAVTSRGAARVVEKTPKLVPQVVGGIIGGYTHGPLGILAGGVVGGSVKELSTAALAPLARGTSGLLTSGAEKLRELAFIAGRASRNTVVDGGFEIADTALRPISRAAAVGVPLAAGQYDDEAAAGLLGLGGVAGLTALPRIGQIFRQDPILQKFNKGLEIRKEIDSGVLTPEDLASKQSELQALGLTEQEATQAYAATRLATKDILQKFPALESELYEPKRQIIEAPISGNTITPAIRELTDAMVWDRPVSYSEGGQPKVGYPLAHVKLPDGGPAIQLFDTSVGDTAINALQNTPAKRAAAKLQGFVDDAGAITPKGQEYLQQRMEQFNTLQRVVEDGQAKFIPLEEQFNRADAALKTAKDSIKSKTVESNARLGEIEQQLSVSEELTKRAPDTGAKLATEQATRQAKREAELDRLARERATVYPGNVLTPEGRAKAQVIDSEIARITNEAKADATPQTADALIAQLQAEQKALLDERQAINDNLVNLASSLNPNLLAERQAAVQRLKDFQDLGLTSFTPGKAGTPAVATSVKPRVIPTANIKAPGRVPGWQPTP